VWVHFLTWLCVPDPGVPPSAIMVVSGSCVYIGEGCANAADVGSLLERHGELLAT
jgi:hypothetical protein